MVTPTGETVAKYLEVVDLAVEHGPYGLVFVRDRLVSRDKIDDPEPSHPEADAVAHVLAAGVRSPMGEGIRHASESHRVDRPSVLTGDASNTAHLISPWLSTS